jgi:hypothetical protein
MTVRDPDSSTTRSRSGTCPLEWWVLGEAAGPVGELRLGGVRGTVGATPNTFDPHFGVPRRRPGREMRLDGVRGMTGATTNTFDPHFGVPRRRPGRELRLDGVRGTVGATTNAFDPHFGVQPGSSPASRASGTDPVPGRPRVALTRRSSQKGCRSRMSMARTSPCIFLVGGILARVGCEARRRRIPGTPRPTTAKRPTGGRAFKFSVASRQAAPLFNASEENDLTKGAAPNKVISLCYTKGRPICQRQLW